MKKLPNILGSKRIAESRLFTIDEVHLRFSNGNERHYERVNSRGSGAVMVVPILNDDTLLLIREYGNGVGDYVLGFPKGAIEKDEDLLVTANRELMEEVGYGAKQCHHLRSLSLSPGYLSAMMQIVVARDLYSQRMAGDEPESIEVVEWPLAKIDALLDQPDFNEARSIAALFLCQRYLKELHASTQ